MPSCLQCEKQTPVTNFLLLRLYVDSYGYYWYFCSLRCLKHWLKDKVTESDLEDSLRH